MRVLIVKTSSLGDVIHTLPAVTDAARAIPGIAFDWVVEEPFAEIPAWHPAVAEVIPVALRRWRKSLHRQVTRREWRACKLSLRRRPYDAVIDAQGLVKSALLARLVPGPRYGMDRQSAREPLATTVYHHKIKVPREMHAVERTRSLFAGALDYSRPAERGDYGVRDHLQAAADGLPPSLLFFHGTARAEKLWPEEHWLGLAERAAAAGYKVWLPWGNDAEKARAARIAAAAPLAEVLPQLNLVGLAGMLLEVAGSVAVDTGLGHLAAALDVPTVSLYGPTRVDLIGAYGAHQAHIQSPVGVADTGDPLAMMSSIEPERVWETLAGIIPGGRA